MPRNPLVPAPVHATEPNAADLSEAQSRVLAAIRGADEPITVLAMAKSLELHPNTVRFHVEALEAKGLVEKGRQPTGGKGRPRLTFSPTEAGARGGERNFKLLSDVLIEHLVASSPDPRASARSAGRTWGNRLAETKVNGRQSPKRVVVDVLEEMGFEPDGGAPRSPKVLLRNCPFREAVDQHQDVVCAIHQGLLDGLAAAHPGPRTQVELRPFSDRGACSVHFAPA